MRPKTEAQLEKIEDKAKAHLLAYLDRKKMPLLIGEAALELGALWSLKDTEALLDRMVVEGTIRQTTVAETIFVDAGVSYLKV
jgi:hypothetical protein